MDRRKVYPAQGVLDEDLLQTNRLAYIALARLAGAIMGGAAVANGLACTPGAGLNVSVAPGELYAFAATDVTAYGSLPTDATQIMKQGVLAAAVTLAVAAPGSAGQARFYLIQAQVQPQDTDPVVLPYYDVADPSQPWAGPNNDGSTNTTTRKDVVAVQAKAGAAADAGLEAIPAPDAGWTPLYAIRVLNGQTGVSVSDIRKLPSSAVLTRRLPQINQSANAMAYSAGRIL